MLTQERIDNLNASTVERFELREIAGVQTLRLHLRGGDILAITPADGKYLNMSDQTKIP